MTTQTLDSRIDALANNGVIEAIPESARSVLDNYAKERLGVLSPSRKIIAEMQIFERANIKTYVMNRAVREGPNNPQVGYLGKEKLNESRDIFPIYLFGTVEDQGEKRLIFARSKSYSGHFPEISTVAHDAVFMTFTNRFEQ